MTYAGDMVDDLRDRLDDATDTQISLPAKIRYLNRGQAAMFPRVYRLVRDSSLVLADGSYEYNFPAGVGTGRVLSVEVELIGGRYQLLQEYDVVPSITVPTLVLTGMALPSIDGAKLRITCADRLVPYAATTYAAAGAEVYSGPAGTEELPVLYAMGLATARPLDGRMSYNRYSTAQQSNPINPGDIMQASQFWFSQFEVLLDRMQMPFPAARN